jgi:hypothetical protein
VKASIVNFLEETTVFDRAARDALEALLDEHPGITDAMFAGVVSALAWELRDRLSPKELQATDIIATFACRTRNVEGYPGSERWVASVEVERD